MKPEDKRINQREKPPPQWTFHNVSPGGWRPQPDLRDTQVCRVSSKDETQITEGKESCVYLPQDSDYVTWKGISRLSNPVPLNVDLKKVSVPAYGASLGSFPDYSLPFLGHPSQTSYLLIQSISLSNEC